MPPINSNCIQSKSHVEICTKNYHGISHGVSVQELLSNNSKLFIDNCDIARVDDEVTWIEEMPPTRCNCIENKSYSSNYNKSSHNDDRMNSEEQELDNLESFE